MNKKIIVIACIAVLAVACKKDTQKPGRVFMPDMAYSKASEPYSTSTFFEDGMSARTPVKGTIPRGFKPYHYPFTKEGYEAAGNEVTNPVPLNEMNLAEGERLYSIYCMVCHGESGMGDGSITDGPFDPFPPPPAYSSNQLKDLPEGKMFHSVTYGKLNTYMPSYASQLNTEERWKVIHYIQTLQKLQATDDDGANEANAVEEDNNNAE